MHQIRQKKPKPSKRKWINDERRPVRSQCDERRATTAPRDLIDRARRSRRSSAQCDCPTNGVIDDRCSPIWAFSSLTLSLIWALSSLSLSLSFSGNELKWKWGWKIIPGQRWKFRSTGSYFPENEIYRRCQTPGFRGKWFPEIIFPQNKCTLKTKSAEGPWKINEEPKKVQRKLIRKKKDNRSIRRR